MTARSKRSRKTQTRGKKTRDTLSRKELIDLCRNLDYEGMMRHKKQATKHLFDDSPDSFRCLFGAVRTHSDGLARLDKILRFALSSAEAARATRMCSLYAGSPLYDVVRASLNCENVAVLEFLETSGIVENYWKRFRGRITAEDFFHCYPTTKLCLENYDNLEFSVTAIDWAVERDPSLLPYIFKKLCETADVEAAKRYGEDFARFFRGNRNAIDWIMWVSHEHGEPECAIEFLRFVLSTADGRANRDMYTVQLHSIAKSAVKGGAEEVLNYLADEENAWRYLKSHASDDVPCMCVEWFAARDPTMLPHLYMMRYMHGGDVWDEDEHSRWARLFEQYMHNPKPRMKHIQKIGTILDENTSALKENDYRVCMDTLMKLM